MGVEEFQKLLAGISGLAEENNGTLTATQVKEYFEGTGVEAEQLLKVFQYLKLKGIALEGLPDGLGAAEEAGTAETREKIPAVPLTSEEKAYLENYLDSLPVYQESGKSEKDLFRGITEGDEMARMELAQRFMRLAAEIAKQMNCEEIPFSDLIQEANVSLLMALEAPEVENPDGNWLKGEISRGIREAIREQTQRKFEDDCLVAKVENLDAALKELTEDEEDGKTQFSLNELAIILDMDVEEIQNVLRLTGEDK